MLFCISLVVYKSECKEVFHAECKGNGNIVIILWNVALLFESLVSTFLCVYSSVPFDAAYASERMDTWMMLCFGESVIALLNTSMRFTTGDQASKPFSMLLHSKLPCPHTPCPHHL